MSMIIYTATGSNSSSYDEDGIQKHLQAMISEELRPRLRVAQELASRDKIISDLVCNLRASLVSNEALCTTFTEEGDLEQAEFHQEQARRIRCVLTKHNLLTPNGFTCTFEEYEKANKL